ncbi:MAG: HSP20-like chaperone protein [Paenibacillus sp.]|nr:HSP20-like chaperone protein [Paenibacillus sp.]
MSRSKDDHAIPGTGEGLFDWDDFQNHFFGGGGWKEAWGGKPSGTIPWVDRYVKGILADAVPVAVSRTAKQSGRTRQAGQSEQSEQSEESEESGHTGQTPPFPSKLTSIACNVFETHRALIVRIRLSADVALRDIRLFATPHELKVSGLPGAEEKTVKLSTAVRADGARAICKQRILEVTLPKEEVRPAIEVPIRHMEGG